MLHDLGMTDDSLHDRQARYQGGQDIRDRAFDYSRRVVDFCEQLATAGGVGRLMIPQLLNCSLSFATMLEEAAAAESDEDFISKYCIGLKECRESWTRMRVCTRCRKGPQQQAQTLVKEGNELISIVTAIVKKKRKNVAAKRAAEKAAKAAERAARRGKPPVILNS
jgi:four helix bundle protein